MNIGPIFPEGDSEFDAVYAEEAAMIDASELIAHALKLSGMTKTQLSQALGVSKSEISARLAGERNITVRKLAATLHALDARLVLEISTSADEGASDRDSFFGWKPPRVNSERRPAAAASDASPYANWQTRAAAQ